ncbi:hypothetical protein [Tropicimonas sp. IMCC6043]|uniref:hypothetical protein n=1 Tax=Tropicimonas sp. IMCC6043 TaxID=2510645 RepID=UPI00101C4574|nr:hypothetical protein [Tropicimonas sp. IMCC6043]RYH07795.1 hypothetical protein EU800_18925 [Tropicimonas sp. IMCC6043]
MPRLSALVERFPERELEILRLCARDTEFRYVCEDYEAAVKALRHWQSVDTNALRVVEYRQLAGEIADEITERLGAGSASVTSLQDNRSGQAPRSTHEVWEKTNTQREME